MRKFTPNTRQSFATVLTALLLLSTVGGCSHDAAQSASATTQATSATTAADAASESAKSQDLLKAAKEKPKPDFDPMKLRIVPQKTDESDVARRMVKPGHWTAASEETKANNFDFVGQLFAEVRDEAAGPPFQIDHTPYRLSIIRQAPLAKGQPKFLELLFFVPPDVPHAWLSTELRNRGGSVAATPGSEPLSLMKPYQFNLVVLTSDPDRYRRLEQLDSIAAPHGSADLEEPLTESLQYYQVIVPPLKQPLPLPSNSLAWTSIAYLMWDDVDPNLLTADQQHALLDWLHWGGQIIISGPKSLDQLRGKNFLGPYLPALAGEPIALDAKMLQPLNDNWTLPVRGQPGRQLSAEIAWSGIKLIPQPGANSLLNTGDGATSLVAERRIGRGRIVTTAFRLSQRELWNWPGFDGFFNAFLLRRLPREFSRAPNLAGLAVDWADTNISFDDPAQISRLRYLSRDWNAEHGFNSPLSADRSLDQQSAEVESFLPTRRANRTMQPGEQPLTTYGSGVAGWNDDSAVGSAARDILRDAAGIVIPKAGFVVRVLALYLVVLVPLNWLIFRAMGRVEWAWIAAPIIAVGGMAAVVKLAQLDIGFARSQSEVAVLEMHNGYPRGHLTRYTAVYTSLSTTYDANAEQSSTLILPFPADPNFALLPGQSTDTVTYHCEPPVQLADFTVASNSTEFLHSEQIIDLGGSIDYAPASNSNISGRLTNNTKHNLTQTAILQRLKVSEDPRESYRIAWVGDLPAGQAVDLEFVSPSSPRLAQVLPHWSFALHAAGDSEGPKMNLDPLADLLRGPKSLALGEVRLLALIDHPLEGLNVDPAASQTDRGATLVVVHLQPPPLKPDKPTADKNTRRDIVTGRPSDLPLNELEPDDDSPIKP